VRLSPYRCFIGPIPNPCRSNLIPTNHQLELTSPNFCNEASLPQAAQAHPTGCLHRRPVRTIPPHAMAVQFVCARAFALLRVALTFARIAKWLASPVLPSFDVSGCFVRDLAPLLARSHGTQTASHPLRREERRDPP
jgi:hypothetical protein